MIDGSEEHKDLFCKTFIETHRAFEPAELPWPRLDEVSIGRLRAIPFWSVALAAERNAGIMVTAFAKTLIDPTIREAFALQGYEETRHAALLAEMLSRYGVAVADADLPAPRIDERAFIDFGYEECIDSFFGFGIFGLAREVQVFVPELTDIFEYVLLEEARHITFFVNWMAYERIRRGRGAASAQALSTGVGYVRALMRIAKTFGPGPSKSDGKQIGFAAEGAFTMFEGTTWRSFLESCVRQNDHYLAEVDARLGRPRVLPAIASALLKLPKLPPLKRTKTAAA